MISYFKCIQVSLALVEKVRTNTNKDGTRVERKEGARFSNLLPTISFSFSPFKVANSGRHKVAMQEQGREKEKGGDRQ